MAIFVHIGAHRINPLNVAYLQPIEFERVVTETVGGKTQLPQKEKVSAVEIITLAAEPDNKILIEGAPIEDIERALNIGLNAVPDIHPEATE